MQVHQLRVVMHAVEQLWVHRLRDRRVEVGGLELVIRQAEPDVHVVVVLMEHIAQHVAIGGVWEPETCATEKGHAST